MFVKDQKGFRLLYDSMGDHVTTGTPTTGIAQWVMDHGQAAFVQDTSTDERFNEKADLGFEVKSIMAVPLFGEDGVEVTGVLEVINKAYEFDDTTATQFSASEFELIQMVALQLAHVLGGCLRKQEIDRKGALCKQVRTVVQSLKASRQSDIDQTEFGPFLQAILQSVQSKELVSADEASLFVIDSCGSCTRYELDGMGKLTVSCSFAKFGAGSAVTDVVELRKAVRKTVSDDDAGVDPLSLDAAPDILIQNLLFVPFFGVCKGTEQPPVVGVLGAMNKAIDVDLLREGFCPHDEELLTRVCQPRPNAPT